MLKNFFTLIGVTVFAQFLSFCASPILTRLYSVEDFSFFAVFVSVTAIIGSLSLGGFNNALIVCKTKYESNLLFIASSILSFVFALLLFFIFILSTKDFLLSLAVFFGIFIFGVYSSFIYLLNSMKDYNLISKNRVFYSIFNIIFSIVFSFFKYGLVLSQILSQFIVIFINLKKKYKEIKSSFKISKLKFIFLFKRYKKFLYLGSLPKVLEDVAVQIPILFFAKAYDTYIGGFYFLAYKVTYIPFSVISSSFYQLFFKFSSDNIYHINLIKHILKAFCFLFLLGLPLILTIIFFSDSLFPFIFGEAWREAGKYAIYISLLVYFRFIVSPLVSTFYVIKKLNFSAFWQVLYFIYISIFFLYAYINSLEVFLVLKLFVIFEFFMYLLYFLILLSACNKFNKGIHKDKNF